MNNDLTEKFFRWLDGENKKPKDIAKDLCNSPQTVSSWRSKGIPKGKELACLAIMNNQLHSAEKLPNRLVHELTREQFSRWNQAALDAGKTIEQWAFDGLEELAKKHLNDDNDSVNKSQTTYSIEVPEESEARKIARRKLAEAAKPSSNDSNSDAG